MPPNVALLLCVGFICTALYIDVKRTPHVSHAIWVPLTWLIILASRPVPAWLTPPKVSTAEAISGDAVDRMVLLSLIAMAAVILARRGQRWASWAAKNRWIVIFFIYCGISVIWSDYPAISFRRWTRSLGAVMMILVILTEDDPAAAIATAVRRCAIVLIPVSVLFIKYYRELGVGYNIWTGDPNIFGATNDKNALGRLCMITALFAFWEFLAFKTSADTPFNTLNKLSRLLIFTMSIWLLKISHSATSFVCFLLGCITLLALGRPAVQKRAKYLGTLILIIGAVVALLNSSLDLKDAFLHSLGKNPTLTNRTFIWHDLLIRVQNPIIGVGYDSFWLGDRLDYFVRVHKVTSAHDGYLDIYLELGFIGLILFALMLHGIFTQAKRSLMSGVDFGRLSVAVLLVFLAYNVTEAGWRATHLSFFVLLLVGIYPPFLHQTAASSAANVTERSPKSAMRQPAKRHSAPVTPKAPSSTRDRRRSPIARRRP
jgi:exopolysaccharide production protein ExoQ